MDFVVKRPEGAADLFECKIDPDQFDSAHLGLFREYYPLGTNHVASPGVKTPYQKRHRGHVVQYVSLP